MMFLGIELLVWLGLWIGAGAICGLADLYCDWYRGSDIEASEVAICLTITSLGGFVTCLFMMDSFFQAMVNLLSFVFSPLNFTIKGRKRK